MGDERSERQARQGPGGTWISLEAMPERRLLRQARCDRHVDFHLQVARAAGEAQSERQPLRLALVMDRSGSMRGEKVRMARRAARAVLTLLDARDRVAVVVFDDRIDTIQPAAPATADIKAHARAALERIDARGSTALHEGWLTGCEAIAEEGTPQSDRALARCFLLTDGLANVGIQEPDEIASQAADVRRRAGIGTSTFGIGDDYNEALLGPIAAASGGEFYHLRSAEEITGTFIGELGELLAVAARQVRLEIETGPEVGVTVVSAYRPSPADGTRWSIPIGDLLSGEERHVVVRFAFPAHADQGDQTLRTRVVWLDDGRERSTDWRELRLLYAHDEACEAEQPDPAVLHWVGLEQAYGAQREALAQNQRGDWQGAHRTISDTVATLRYLAAGDPALQASVEELRQMEQELERGRLPQARSKEAYYQSQSRSRGKSWRDFRGPGPTPGEPGPSQPSGPAQPSGPSQPPDPSRPSGQ